MSLNWAPGGDFGSPTYSLPIAVVDGIRSTVFDERRARWQEALELALERWALPFNLSHRAELNQPFVANDQTISSLGVNPLVIAGKVAFVRLHTAVAGDSAGWIEQMGGGICLLTPWRGWWIQGGRAQIASVVAHELGHALGFGHGGTGVMVGRPRPNDEERALAAAYYG